MWIIGTMWQVHIFASPFEKGTALETSALFPVLVKAKWKRKGISLFCLYCDTWCNHFSSMWVCHGNEITIPCFSTNLSVQQQSKLMLGISSFGFSPRNVRKMLACCKTRPHNARLDSAREFWRECVFCLLVRQETTYTIFSGLQSAPGA